MERLDDHPSPSRLYRYTRRHRFGGGEGLLSRSLPAWLRAVFAGCLLLLLLSCAKGDRVAGGTSETETGTASGNLVLKGGAAAQGARVTLFAAGEDTGTAAAGGRTAVTDASGAYRFDSLAFNTYNMTAIYIPAGSKDTLAASRLKIAVAKMDRDVEVGVDTLRGPGAVSARVLFLANPVEEALCYVPGTSYLALTDSGGRCLVSGIPPGRYRLSIKADGYLTARASDSVMVATDDTVRLGDVRLQLDERLAPPKPTGLKAVFDTSTRKVTLSWSGVPAGDLAGYSLYRDPADAVAFSRLFPNRLMPDTFFVDSLAGFKPGTDTVLAYRIKAQDKTGEQSGFALFDTVRVRMGGTSAPYTFLYPEPGDTLVAGDTVWASWVSDSVANSVHMELYHDSMMVQNLGIWHKASDTVRFQLLIDYFPGNYHLRITDMGDTARFANSPVFRVGLPRPDPFEPDDSISQAKSIATDGKPQDRIVSKGLWDWISFEAAPGKRYLASLAPEAYMDLALADSAGRTLARGNIYGARVSLNPPYAGRYYLRVATDSLLANSAVNYQVSVAAYDTAAPKGRIGFSAPAAGEVLTVGQSYRIAWEADRAGQGNTVALKLYDDMGEVRYVGVYLDNTGSCLWNVPADLQPWDRYHIRLESMGSGSTETYPISAVFTLRAASP